MPEERLRIWNARHANAQAVGEPAPVVVDVLSRLAVPPGGRALDLACGRGRHALAAARCGYRVDAVDWALPALRTLAATARAGGLPIACVAADVTRWPIPAEHYDLVIVVDFLERALLPAIRAAVRPGGVLIVETFLAGQERFGHPRNPAYLLAPGELDAVGTGWESLLRHEGLAEAGARRAMRAGIVVRRPAR